MKRCPECRKVYTDETLNFCLEDGAILKGGLDEQPTVHFSSTLDGAAVSRTSLEPSEGKSIAVLPFSNVSADPENEFFCDGLAEELISSLAKIEGLKVASRTSSFSFKGKGAKIADIASALRVTSVLEGSVRRAANRLRVNVQLINVADDRPVWSERYDREMEDIFDVQDEIALSVVDALKVKLLGDERAAVLKRYTNNPKAYELFLKGRFHWYKHTPEDIRKSLDYFLKAIEIDPNYAPGHAGLGEFYGISSAFGYMDPAKGWPLAESGLRRARELDDALAEVHNGLAAVRGMYYRDLEGAERELRRAMELNPSFAEAHNLYSFILTGQGRHDEAILHCKAALELDPLSISYNRYLGWWLYYARRFDEAIEKYRQVSEMQPDFPLVYGDMRDVFAIIGKKDEAVAAWRHAAILTGDNELLVALDGSSDAEGAIAEAVKLELDRLSRRQTIGEWVPPAEIARCHVRLGNTEDALLWLEKSSDVRDTFSLLMRVDPFYDALRDDPRFNEVLDRIDRSKSIA